MARSEVMLASKLKPMQVSDFSSTAQLKRYLVRCIHERRKGIQRGIITEMAQGRFDPDADFIKIGRGSLAARRGASHLPPCCSRSTLSCRSDTRPSISESADRSSSAPKASMPSSPRTTSGSSPPASR